MNPIRWKESNPELPPLTAVKLAQLAVEQNPNDPQQFMRLGLAHEVVLNAESAESAWSKAISLDSSRPEYHYGRAKSLVLLRRFDEAIGSAQLAINLDATHAPPHALIANSQRRLANPAEAIEAARKALVADPDHIVAANCLIETLRDEQRLVEAEGICAEMIRRKVHSTKTLALHAILLAKLNRMTECESLLNFDQLLHQTEIPIPVEELKTLNDDLSEMVDERPDLQFEPSGYPVKGGSQLLLNHEKDRPSLKHLTSFIRSTVNDYISKLDSTNPWTHLAPDELNLSLWAVTLEQEGQSTCHIHHDGWISGVYYVEVPPSPETSLPPPGAILLGPPPEDDATHSDIPSRYVMPRPGTLILFPSYIYHRTIPTVAPTPRTCIAFDVL
ncbi:MAG: putative 2OG-Fe(II) oxygenase [Verrucomicrobiota bacterium]